MKQQKGSIASAMVAIIAILTIVGGAYVYVENKKISKINTNNTTPLTQSTSTDIVDSKVEPTDNTVVEENFLVTANEKTNIISTSTPVSRTNEIKIEGFVNVDADIQTVSDIMQKYKLAYESGNTKTMNTFYSKATLDFFKLLGGGFSVPAGSKMTIGKIIRSGKNIRAETVETKSNGSKENQSYVFIPENGQWKIDIEASFTSDMQKSNVSQGDPNGYVDLVVTGIKVYPSRPIVNSEDVEIAVTIKNIGTKISQKGAPAIATIIENTEYTPTQGGWFAPIVPGESVTWKYGMYGQNNFFKRSDVPGKKTVQVVLNGYEDVVEKNYTNNSFTYSFEVFEK